jgi:hypothetical protein
MTAGLPQRSPTDAQSRCTSTPGTVARRNHKVAGDRLMRDMAREPLPEIELLRETEAPLFVINLCASTTPVALAHPDNPELKRYTFFVTRRREEGRERFRLHMGYFDKLDAAEKLLAIVRDVYPAAWAGPAPGNKGTASRAAPTPPTAAPVAAPRAVASPAPPTPVVAAPRPAPAPAHAPAHAPARAPAIIVAAPKPPPVLETMSNVREVLAELGDDPRRLMQPPKHIPELKVESTGRHAIPPVTLAAAASLSDSQVLRVLEERRVAPVVTPPVPSDTNAATSIRMISPEDTQTLRDIKLDVQSNASVSFAVQLQWSVQPIDMNTLPTLAIFDAYTLYTVEGNRQGRRWYGLRLGFFSDAMSAKQVAYYVRSDFSSVAVVPVTAKERDRASGKGEPSSRAALDTGATGTFIAPVFKPVAGPSPATKPAAAKANSDTAGFKLLDNDTPAPRPDPAATASGKAAVKGKVAKPTGKRPAVRGRAARGQSTGAPQTLEQTLEVLGASTLTIDESRTIINDSGVRHLDAQITKKKTSRFSRLLDRLSEKM